MQKLFVISGSSGVGKGTIIAGFLKNNPNFKLSVSCTTRAIRSGEVHGINYFFLSHEEFNHSIKNDEFLEWSEHFSNKYGTKKSFVEKCLKNNENLLLEIDTVGALNVKKQFKDAVLIFILPPSFDVLEKRLRGRNTESEESISKRLDFIKLEMKNSENFDYTIVNDNLDVAINELESIIQNEKG